MAAVIIGDATNDTGTPADGSDLYFEGGNTAITQNVTLDANTYPIIEVSRARTGDIATSGTPFRVEACSTRLVYNAMAGTFYFQCDTTAALIQCLGAGQFQFVASGTATRFEVLNGSATIAGACVATNVRVAGGSTYIINTGASTAQTLLHLMSGPSGGGQVWTQRGATTMTNESGTLNVDNEGTAVTNLLCTGHHQVAKTILEDIGTITAGTFTGHIPDVSRLARPLTITAETINMSLPNAQAFLDHPLITHSSVTRLITDGRNL